MAKFSPSIIDNAILKVFPGWGLSRIKSQVEAGMISGAYESTRPGNRPFSNYTQFLTSPNSRATSLERQKLINFSRFLCMSSIGTAITNRLTDHAVGSGLNFRASVNTEFLGLGEKEAKVKNQELTRLWNTFFSAENGNYERMYSGGYFQSIAFKSMLEGGDNFVLPVRTKPRKNHRFPFALQTLESERISTPTGLESNERFYQGIEKNENGIPVRIYISKTTGLGGSGRESSYFNPNDWDSRTIFGAQSGIRQVFQIKNLAQDRPMALRGIPFLTPATGLIIDHQEFTASVLKAAKIQSIFAALWKGTGKNKFGGAPGDNQTAGTNSSFPRVDLTAGQIVDLSGVDGELTAFETSQPMKEFTPFTMQILQLIGSITGIPVSFILMMFTKSFSASRGETAIFWTTVLRNRYAFIFQFLYPFWEYLLSWAVSSGMISAPGFFDNPEIKAAYLGSAIHQFSGPRMPQLDLEKEAKGLVALRDGGFKSTRGIIEESFDHDPDEVFREIDEEKERGIIQAVANATQQLIDENETKPDEE